MAQQLDDLDFAEQKIKEQEKKRQQAELKQKHIEFDQRVEKVHKMLIEYAIKYKNDPENYNLMLIKMLYDVIIQMKEAIDNIQAIRETTSVLFEAIDFIDLSLDDMTTMFTASLGHDYGFFARLKRKREMKRAQRNMQGRMEAMADTINGIQDMSIGITQALYESTERMKKSMDKAAKKRQKKNGGKGGSGAPAVRTKSDEEIEKYRQEHPEEFGGDAGVSEETAAPSETTSGGGSTGGSNEDW